MELNHHFCGYDKHETPRKDENVAILESYPTKTEDKHAKVEDMASLALLSKCTGKAGEGQLPRKEKPTCERGAPDNPAELKEDLYVKHPLQKDRHRGPHENITDDGNPFMPSFSHNDFTVLSHIDQFGGYEELLHRDKEMATHTRFFRKSVTVDDFAEHSNLLALENQILSDGCFGASYPAYYHSGRRWVLMTVPRDHYKRTGLPA